MSYPDGADPVLSLTDFARGFALRTAQTAWLVGAGTSAEAGIPTASQLIDRLLATLYCSDNGITVERMETNPRWREVVYLHYDGRNGLPPLSDVTFYSAIFERVYPDRDARGRFVLDECSGYTPHHGQHILAGLVADSCAPLIVTTNFDTLIEDAVRPMLAHAAPDKRLTVLDPDNSARASFALAADQLPLLVKIHGDLGSVTLANTSSELAEHDRQLRAAIQAQLSRFGLIVAGYSGRDPAVMATLHAVLQQPNPYPAGLTWVRRPETPLTPEVREFLTDARSAGVEPVHEVVTGGFTELMTELRRASRISAAVAERLDSLQPPPVRVPASRPSGQAQNYPQIRFGAVELTGRPLLARELDVPGAVTLTDMRAALRTARIRATIGRVGGTHAAFGNDAELASALGPLGVRLTSDTIPVGELSGGQPDSTDVGMLAEALAQACGHIPGLTCVLRTGQRHLVRVRAPRADHPNDGANVQALRTAVGGTVCGELKGPGRATLPWAESVSIAVDYTLDRWWLLFAPDIWVRRTYTGADAATLTRADAQRAGAEFVRERVAPRYNRQAGAILGAWLGLLSRNGQPLHAHRVSPGEGMEATFTLSGNPLVSRQLSGHALPINPRSVR